jgi:hypothetical protein
MGKSKAKGPKQTAQETLPEVVDENLASPGLEAPLRAADGHNVDGWADDDIRTYNELLTERAKLEKEKNELEQKSSRHQTQRALLDENATALDSLFKAQLGGDFKFTGSGVCCLDFDAGCGQGNQKNKFPCKHELCSRSKTKGVSWMEMDTIKYYHARILSEKSSRMQNALRKQRDVELVRVKKDDEEDAALRARKSAILDKSTRTGAAATKSKPEKSSQTSDTPSLDLLPAASKDFLLDPKNSAILEAAKENEHIVRRIRGRLDKIRHDVNAGRVSPADARVKLDQANSEMAEAERKNNEFRQLILDAEPALSHLQPNTNSQPGATNVPASLTTVLQNTLATSNTDAFSQALSVMKGFFSASDPHDVQTAITDLRSVLELNGPMSPVLQKSFKALEEMLSKPGARGLSIDMMSTDGRHKSSNGVVEHMLNLRYKLRGTKDISPKRPDELNVDADIIKVNSECMKVEDAAIKDMNKMAERMVDSTNEALSDSLKKIKKKASAKSPVPDLSDVVLDDIIADILFRKSLKGLINEAVEGASEAQLSGKLTSMIIATAKHKPTLYLEILKTARSYVPQAKKDPPQIMFEVLDKVEISMRKFVTVYNEKQAKLAAAAAQKAAPPLPTMPDAPIEGIDTKQLVEGLLMDEEEYRGFQQFLETPGARSAVELRQHIARYYNRNIEEGIWHMLYAVLNRYSLNKFSWGDWEYEKTCYTENLQLALNSDPQTRLVDIVAHLQQLSLCPARAAIVLAQRITMEVRDNIEMGQTRITGLRNLFPNIDTSPNREWIRSFTFIVQAMADMFEALFFCAVVVTDKADRDIMVADVLGFVCTFSIGAADPVKGEMNLRYTEQLVLKILVEVDSGSPQAKKLQDIFSRFAAMSRDPSNRYRCAAEHNCQARFCQHVTDKLGPLVPPPLQVNKAPSVPAAVMQPVQPQPAAAPPVLLTREKQMRLMANAYWEVARSLTPHLYCISNDKMPCRCGLDEKEQNFADEINCLKINLDVDLDVLDTMIKKDQAPPKSLLDTLERNIRLLHEKPVSYPANQQRLIQLRTRVANAHAAKVLPKQQTSGQATATPQQSISLKQVPVNTPSIQPSTSSTVSAKGNVHQVPASTQAVPESVKQSLIQARSPSPFQMTAREISLRDQLLSFTDSVDTMHTFASVSHHPAAASNQHALDGVAWQVEDMLIGHIEMAYLIAKAQGYTGLENWMEYYYAQTTPLGEHDDDESDELDEDEGNDAGNGEPSAAAVQAEVESVKARVKSLQKEMNSKALEKIDAAVAAKAPTPSQQPPAPAPVNPIQPLQMPPSMAATVAAVLGVPTPTVADYEVLGREYLKNVEILRTRRTRRNRR